MTRAPVGTFTTASARRREGHWMQNGTWSSDFPSSGEDLAATLDDFDRGVFTFLGERWRVSWLDEEDSRTSREQHGFELSES